jgi:hypothetical protein
VCDGAGICNPCTQGSVCTSGIGDCQTGATDCSTGKAVCKASNKNPGTSCGNGPSCSAATLYPHQVCDSNGQCYTPNGTPCASGLCNGSSACQDCTQSTAPSSILVSGAMPICSGTSLHPGSVTLTRSGGSLGLGARWVWYKGSLPPTAGGGIATGDTLSNVSPTETTTYYLRAEGTCNVSAAASKSVVVYTAPQISVSPVSQSVDCTVAYTGWTTVYATLSGSSAPTNSILWFYTSAATSAKTLEDPKYVRNNSDTTLNLTFSPQVNSTEWIQVIDVCGQEGWGSSDITVPDICVCFEC